MEIEKSQLAPGVQQELDVDDSLNIVFSVSAEVQSGIFKGASNSNVSKVPLEAILDAAAAKLANPTVTMAEGLLKQVLEMWLKSKAPSA